MYLVYKAYIPLSDIVRNLCVVAPDWDVYGKIVASEYRQQTLHSLHERPKTPTQIADDIGKHQSHVSKTLQELVEFNLVKCLNPTAKKGRLYKLTEQGEDIHSQLKEEGYFDE